MLVRILLGAVVLLLVPSLWLDRVYGTAFWHLGRERLQVLGFFAAAFLVGAIYLRARSRATPARLWEVLIVAAVSSVGVVAVVTMLDLQASIPSMAMSTALIWAMCVAFFWTVKLRPVLTGLLAVAAVGAAGVHALYYLHYLPQVARPAAQDRFLHTSLYNLRIRTYSSPVTVRLQSGGAIDKLWDDYLLATGDGELYRFAPDGDGTALRVTPLKLHVPTNPDAFRTDTEGLGLNQSWFRVADVYALPAADAVTLVTTHHVWYSGKRCFTVRVSSVTVPRPALDSAPATTPWTTLFETAPCLPLTLPQKPQPFFAGLQIGGRIGQLPDGKLLVTIGDHEFDGVSIPIAYPQDPAASYGKIFTIDLATKAVEPYAIGLRNPQGLYVDATGAVYETEHGPEGGDELNRIEKGANYGWPVVTYGVNYGTNSWPSNPHQGSHDGYAEPLFVWVPSIGVSSLTGAGSPSFPLWNGDLLVSSLLGRALWRVRLDGNRVKVAERIDLGTQVRDITVGHRGEFVLWNEQRPGPEILFITPAGTAGASGGPVQGSELFTTCFGCHRIGDGATHALGPNLNGVVGSPVASKRGYAYSEALRRVGGEWTPARLDAFLAAPEKFAPGTSMRIPGIDNAEHRKKLIEFLASH